MKTKFLAAAAALAIATSASPVFAQDCAPEVAGIFSKIPGAASANVAAAITEKVVGEVTQNQSAEILVGQVSSNVQMTEEQKACFNAANVLSYAGLSATTFVSKPVVQSLPEKVEQPAAEAPAAAPETTRTIVREVRVPANVDLSGINSDITKINGKITELQSKQTLTAEEATLLTQFRGIDGLVAKLQNLKAGQPTAELPAETQAALAKLATWSSEADAIEDLKQQNMLQWFGIGFVFLLLGGVVFLVSRSLKARKRESGALDSRLTAVEQTTKDLKDMVPTEIRLAPLWKDLLQKGGRQTIRVLFDGESRYLVVAELVGDDQVCCYDGLMSHNPDNLISLDAFESRVRKAGYFKHPRTGGNRLTKPDVLELREVANG